MTIVWIGVVAMLFIGAANVAGVIAINMIDSWHVNRARERRYGTRIR